MNQQEIKKKLEGKDWIKEKNFELVASLDHLDGIIDQAIESGSCAVDLETTGLDNRIDSNGKTVDSIVGYCLSYNGQDGYYVPVYHIDYSNEDIFNWLSEDDGSTEPEPHPANLNRYKVAQRIKRLCEGARTIYHNAAFDLEFLYGSPAHIQILDPERFDDTYLLSYLRDPVQNRHGLKKLSKDMLGMEMIEIDALSGGDAVDFQKLDPTRDDVLCYTGADAICTYLLYEKRLKEVPSIYDMNELYTIEKRAIGAYRWMERNRPKIDRTYLERLSRQMEDKIKEIKKDIYVQLAHIKDVDPSSEERMNLIKKKFDVDSPKKLGEALQTMKKKKKSFDVDLKRTDSGQIATGEDVIESLAEEYGEKFPFLEKIGILRNLSKVNSTYVKPLLNGGDWSSGGEDAEGALKDNTARFKFNPYGTDSGRFSASKGAVDSGYSGINLQSSPGTYNAATFPVKKIQYRPDMSGEEDAPLYEDYLYARDEQGLVRHEYDEHFIEDIRTGDEYCLRKECEGCPFQDECVHDEPDEKRFLSLGDAFRPAVVGDDDFVMAAIDYSGVELRTAAELSNEETWKEEFIHGEGDGHKQTAKIIYGDDVVDKPDFKMYRQNAKAANFAVLYGGGGGAIANSAGISSNEGWDILRKMKKGIPSYTQWENETISNAKTNGEVRTVLNRRIPLKRFGSSDEQIVKYMERKATNSKIQGSATGDLIKYSMAAVHNEVLKRGWEDKVKMLFAVHDELVFELRKDSLEEVIPVLREKMTEFGKKEIGPKDTWDIPVEVEVELGEVWDTPHEWKTFKEVQEESGLAEKPVPTFLTSHVDFEQGMWYINERGEKRVWDGTDFIPMDSPSFDWGACRDKADGKPLMKAPFPKKFKDDIALHPGMWYEESLNDRGIFDGDTFHDSPSSYKEAIEEKNVKVCSVGGGGEENEGNENEDKNEDKKALNMSIQDNKSGNQDESSEKSNHTESQGDSSMSESDSSISNNETSKQAQTERVSKQDRDDQNAHLPLFKYKIKRSLTRQNGEFRVLKIKQILNFLQAYARKRDVTLSHEIDILSPRGRSILPDDESYRVDPELFMLLATYEGI
jgi:DNA polymerase I-like protein with 3'-5' exonuclease and polymerase domains